MFGIYRGKPFFGLYVGAGDPPKNPNMASLTPKRETFEIRDLIQLIQQPFFPSNPKVLIQETTQVN